MDRKEIQVISSKVICKRKGLPVELQEIIDSNPPDYAHWRVNYAGNGHYFPTYGEAIDYLYKRKFL